jgi:hypothetical protein
MKTLQEFENFFNSDMLPDLEILDERRRKVVKRTIILVLVTILALLLIIVLYSSSAGRWSNSDNAIYFIISGVLVVVAAIIVGNTWAQDKTFYSDFKNQVIGRIVKFVSPDLIYEPKNFIGADSFQRSRIFRGKLTKPRFGFQKLRPNIKPPPPTVRGEQKQPGTPFSRGCFLLLISTSIFKHPLWYCPTGWARVLWLIFSTK